jgi:hypothetical protein
MTNPNATDALPCEGYVIEIGGKFNSEYGTFAAALKAGLELKNKYSQIQVKVSDAMKRAPAALTGHSEQNSDIEK